MGCRWPLASGFRSEFWEYTPPPEQECSNHYKHDQRHREYVERVPRFLSLSCFRRRLNDRTIGLTVYHEKASLSITQRKPTIRLTTNGSAKCRLLATGSAEEFFFKIAKADFDPRLAQSLLH